MRRAPLLGEPPASDRRARARTGQLGLAVVMTFLASPASAQVRAPTHVACVGDSITAGAGASSIDASYPSDLQRLFGAGVQVKNFGHSGATLLSAGDTPYVKQSEYTSATSFVSGAGTTAVVDVVILLGTNDSKSQNWMTGTTTHASQFVVDLGSLVDHFSGLASHPVVYLGLPPRAFTNTYGISGAIIHDQIVPLIRQVAAAKGAPVIDLDAPTTSRMDLFGDGVHPTDAGYQLVAQTVHDALLLPLSMGGQGGRGGEGGSAGAGGKRGGGGVSGQSGNGGRGGAGATGAGGIGGATGGGSGGVNATGTGGGSGGGSVIGTGGGSGGANATGTGGGSGGSNVVGTGSGGANETGTGGGSGGTNVVGTGGGSGGGRVAGTGGASDASHAQSDSGGCACDVSQCRHESATLAGLLALVFVLRMRKIRRPM